MLIKDILERQKENDKIAVDFANEKYSYKDINRTVNLHVNLINEKCMTLNNVGIFINNSLDYVIAYFTIASCNRTIIPIDVMNKANQVISVIEYCEIKLMITNSEYYTALKKMLADSKYKIFIYNMENQKIETAGGFQSIELSENIRCKTCEDDVAIMLHTSGTTSHPKKVMLTHKNLITNIESNIQSLGLKENDICLIVLPMYFGYCNSSQFLTHFYLGAEIVIMKQPFVPAQFLKCIEDKKCTNTTCIPSMLLLTVNDKNKKYNTESLKYLCFGGGMMPVDKLYGIIEFFNHTGIVQTYGQTEASPRVTCLMPKDSLRKIGSVGKAILNVEVRIVNAADEDVGEDETGEIIVRGKNVMKGYYKREEETNRILKNGWLHTGDLGKFDVEGYLYIVGRIKNMLINGGQNVYPEEIEELLMNHPGVKEAIVISEKHELLGEVPIAKIVLNDNSEGYNEFDFIKYCSDNLERYKVPSKILFCTSFEKTYTGKIYRH